VAELVKELFLAASKGQRITPSEIRYAMDVLAQGESPDIASLLDDVICFSARGKPVRPRTLGQKRYIRVISENHVTFAIGPAGTGKTYLAVAVAVAALKAQTVNRIVLVGLPLKGRESWISPGRPEREIEPYLRPLYDAFYELLSPENFIATWKRTSRNSTARLHAWTNADDSFIILDEAQNTTRSR
jgi:phosphate starvation-inducible PhoH-like protein